jgi:hypothetical protein
MLERGTTPDIGVKAQIAATTDPWGNSIEEPLRRSKAT